MTPIRAFLRNWKVFLVFLLILAGGVYALRQQKGQAMNPFLPAPVRMQPQIELQFNQVVMQGRQKGVKRWNIWSKQVQISQDQQFVYFENRPHGSFYNLKDWAATESAPLTQPSGPPLPFPGAVRVGSMGQPLSAVVPPPLPNDPRVPLPSPSPSYYTGKVRSADWVADRAEFDTYAESLRLKGHVIITTDEKDQVKTDTVEYRSREKLVLMPQPLTFRSHEEATVAARQATADMRIDTLDLKGRVKVHSRLKQNGKPSTSSVDIEGENIRVDRPNKLYVAKQAVAIRQDDATIKTESATYDQGLKTTSIDVPVEVVQTPKDEPKTTLNGDSLTMYHAERRLLVEGAVKLVREPDWRPEKNQKPEKAGKNSKNQKNQKSKNDRKAKLRMALKRERSTITADRMEYWTGTKDARFDGNVIAYQREKRAVGDQAVMDNRRGTITLDGNVRLTQIKGNWLVRAGLVDAKKPDKDRDETLKNKTTIDSDSLQIDQRTNDAVANGHVIVRQKGKVATSNRALYSDREQTTTLTEEVRIRQEDTGEWMTASKVVFHHDTEQFEAYGSGAQRAEAEFGLDSKDEKGEKTRILSETLANDRKALKSLATGKVQIKQGDLTIRSERAHYDQKGKISSVDVPVEVVQQPKNEPQTTLTGKALTMFHRQKRALVTGDVKLVRKGVPTAQPADGSRREKLKAAIKREDTTITGDKMEYWTDKKDAKFDGHVVVFQKEKKAEGDQCFLDHKKGTITLTGKVKLTQIKGDWLVGAGLVDTSNPDKERDEALNNPVTIECDKLVIDQKTNNCVATGKIVTIRQKTKTATSKKTVYLDAKQTTTLTDDVHIKREDTGEWMKADKAVLHHDTDRFEAYGLPKKRVETEFSLDDKK